MRSQCHQIKTLTLSLAAVTCRCPHWHSPPPSPSHATHLPPPPPTHVPTPATSHPLRLHQCLRCNTAVATPPSRPTPALPALLHALCVNLFIYLFIFYDWCNWYVVFMYVGLACDRFQISLHQIERSPSLRLEEGPCNSSRLFWILGISRGTSYKILQIY